MPHVGHSPGHWFRRWFVFAGIWLIALAATPRHVAAQCSNSTLILSPCNGAVTVAANSSNQKYVFTLTNELAVQQQVTVSATCTGYVTSCTTSPGLVHLAANGSGSDTVIYSTGNGISGTFKLSVSGLSSTITASAPAHAAPVVTLPYYNYDNVQPSLCAATCFDKVVTYATPAYYTMDTPRSVALMYRSNTANPMVTVQVDAWDNSSTRPTMMSLQIQRPGGSLVTFTNGSTQMFFTFSTSTIPERVGAQFAPQGADTLTGAYNYTAIVTSYFADSTRLQGTTPVRILLENERSSVYGIGWTIAGQQRIYAQSNGDVVITDGAGAISYFTLNSPGCVHSCTYTSPTGDFTQLTTKSADQFGRHYDRRYSDGTIYEFLGSGPLAGIFDKNGNQTIYWYDSQGRDSLISDPLGTSFSYGMHFAYSTGDAGTKVGSIRWIEDPYGRYTWFNVDGVTSTLNLIEDPLMAMQGSSLLYGYYYNSQHQLIGWSDRAGAAHHTGYDFTGKVAADSTPPVVANGSTQYLVTQYASNQLWLTNPSSGQGTSTNPAAFHGGGPAWGTVIDPQGYWTQFTVDRWGQPMTFIHVNVDTTQIFRGGDYYHMGGIPALSITYPWKGVDQFRYNSSGLLSWSQLSGQDSTSYRYGNNFAIADTITGSNQPSQVSTVNGSGNVTAVTMAGRDTTHYYYDTRGRDTMMVDPLGHATKVHYDATFGNQDSTLATGNRFTKLTFDQYGRRYTATASAIATQSTWYDVLNRIVKAAGGAQNDTAWYGYDSTYLVRTRDANGQVFRSSVNALGWPTRIFDPADTTNLYQSLSYDGDGNVIAYTNRRGQTVTMTYDALGRLKSKSGPGILSATYSYSSDWRITVGANAVSVDTIYTDSTGWTNAIATTFPLTSGPQHFRINYYPTSTHELDSSTVTTGGRIKFATRNYTWDTGTGLLSAIAAGGGTLNFYYDKNGLLDATMYDGQVMRYDDHVANYRVYQSRYVNLLQGGVDSVRDPAFHRNYYYDPVNRIAQVTTPWIKFDQTFGYDSLGRFSTETDYPNAVCGSVDTTFGLNCASGGSTVAYQEQYDAVGNLRQSGAEALTYGTGDRILTAGSTQFTTDSEGDVIRRHDSTHDMRYGWSADGMLVSDTVATTKSVAQFDYNAFGRLVHRSTNGTSDRYYLWDGADQLLAEMDGTASHRIGEYVYNGVDNPVMLITGDSTITNARFPQVDELGNVVGVFGFAVSQAINYSPFGQQLITNTALADTNRLRWRGLMWQGDSTQLYYARNRWYDPNTGRFMSQDPVGMAGGVNPYAFANGDYINGYDPSGTCADGETIFSVGVIGLQGCMGWLDLGELGMYPYYAYVQPIPLLTVEIDAPSPLSTPLNPESLDPGLNGTFRVNLGDLSRQVTQRTRGLSVATCTAMNGSQDAFLFGKLFPTPGEPALSLSASDAEHRMLRPKARFLARWTPFVEKAFGALMVANSYLNAWRDCSENTDGY